MTKEIVTFDIDSKTLAIDGLAEALYWIKNNQDKKSSHHVVIKRILEGEVHFLIKDEFLTKLVELLQHWQGGEITLAMADVNLSENIKKWLEGTRTGLTINTVTDPLSLLHRTRSYMSNKSIKQPKYYNSKIKKFICLNGAAKPHRAKMVNDLYHAEYDQDGYISWLNRYGKIHSKYFTNERFTGEDLILDFDNESIDKDVNQEILPLNYHYAGFEIVNESIVSDTSIFLTEKIWKPILYKKFFIVHGCKNTMKYLTDLGFEPYSELYDLDFDSLDYTQRYESLWKEIHKLMRMSPKDWEDVYNDPNMKKKLDHNSTLFRNIEIQTWTSQVYG